MKITVDELKAAMVKTGYKLIKQMYHGFIENKPCGCPLTILYMANHPEYLGSDVVYNWASNRYGKEYCTGIIGGFDFGLPDYDSDGEYNKGVNNGIALRELLK